MRRIVLVSLISFMLSFASTIYVNASSSDTIFKGCPAGADTGITTVVTKLNVGNATDTATIVDSLKEPGIKSESNGLSYFLFRIHYGVSSSVHDTLDRFVWIRIKDPRNVTKSYTIKFDSAKTIDTTIHLVASKLTRVIFKGRATTDSFGIYVENFPSIVPINETTQFTHQFAGLAQETIFPRSRGAIGRDTIMNAYLPAGTRPGYIVTPGAGIRTCKVSSSLPDSGWIIGQATQYQSAAGISSIICKPFYKGTSGGGGTFDTSANYQVSGKWTFTTKYAFKGDSSVVDSMFTTKGYVDFVLGSEETIWKTVQTLSMTTHTHVDLSAGGIGFLAFTGTTDTMLNPTNLKNGREVQFVLKQGASGNSNVVWSSHYIFPGDTATTGVATAAPQCTQAAYARDIFTFVCLEDSFLYFENYDPAMRRGN